MTFSLVRRQPRAEAKRFEGGLDGARDTIEWLHVKNVAAAYAPEILNDGVVVSKEQLLVWRGIHTSGHPMQLLVGDFIVIDPESSVFTATENELWDWFEEAPSGSNPPS